MSDNCSKCNRPARRNGLCQVHYFLSIPPTVIRCVKCQTPFKVKEELETDYEYRGWCDHCIQRDQPFQKDERNAYERKLDYLEDNELTKVSK